MVFFNSFGGKTMENLGKLMIFEKGMNVPMFGGGKTMENDGQLMKKCGCSHVFAEKNDLLR